MLKMLKGELQTPHWPELVAPTTSSSLLEHVTYGRNPLLTFTSRAVETLDIGKTDHVQVKCAQVVGTLSTARLPRPTQQHRRPTLRARPW
jgi:hypothetical protein